MKALYCREEDRFKVNNYSKTIKYSVLARMVCEAKTVNLFIFLNLYCKGNTTNTNNRICTVHIIQFMASHLS